MIKETFRSATFNPFRHIAEKSKHRCQDLEYFDKETAKTTAEEVLKWAKSKGATSFTFWIHPQTNETIQKHDSIYDLQYFFKGFESFELAQRFTAMVLMKGQGDGSSFPNGGMRGTDKARAYIAWEAKSDMFIRQTKNGKVLYIPGMLLTHHGQALDEKTYLLRAQKELKESTVRLMRLLGHNEVKHVMLALGIEQEFFIVPKKDFESRLDLRECGRTLYGKLPPRNQQFLDHYYGKIDNKILEILNQAENELLKVGVPVKTKHKQVAINQYEMACSYESTATAVDHNMLLMDVLRSTFDKHGYTVIFHQKPFIHANGSGKHCNWSIMVNSNEQMKNLFEPGLDPKSNREFVLFILITLKAVLENAALLKASITSPSNQHRMGGHEAPPCIISVFLGSYIDSLLSSIQKGEEFVSDVKDLQKSIPGLVSFLQDNTDRNRTSPFAFTGNKFQFRAVGGKQNASFPMTVIASIMTKGIREVAQELERGVDIDTIIHQLIKETKNIRFEGNGYSRAWEKEASMRGLPNLKSALESFQAVQNAEVLKQIGVFNDKQLKAKYNILMNNYVVTKVADAETLEIIIKQNFLPRILTQLKTLSDLGKDSPVYKLQAPRFQKMYTDLFGAASKLKQWISEIRSTEEAEGQVSKAGVLRQTIDSLSEQISQIETQLPATKEVPQLFEILNTYH